MSETFTPEYFPVGLAVRSGRCAATPRRRASLAKKVWGGGKRSIPSLDHVRPTSPLVGIIGLAATRVLAELHGPGHKLIPRAVGESALIREILIHPGATRACAQDLGCTEEWVRRVRKRRLEGSGRQGDLFGAGTN